MAAFLTSGLSITIEWTSFSLAMIIILLLFIFAVNTTAILYYKYTGFAWWERLPAAIISLSPHCGHLSRLEAAPTMVDDSVKSKVSL
jgi:hypothetical protein